MIVEQPGAVGDALIAYAPEAVAQIAARSPEPSMLKFVAAALACLAAALPAQAQTDPRPTTDIALVLAVECLRAASTASASSCSGTAMPRRFASPQVPQPHSRAVDRLHRRRPMVQWTGAGHGAGSGGAVDADQGRRPPANALRRRAIEAARRGTAVRRRHLDLSGAPSTTPCCSLLESRRYRGPASG